MIGSPCLRRYFDSKVPKGFRMARVKDWVLVAAVFGVASQIAAMDPGQMNDQIRFPGIDDSAVQEVLLTTSAGRCFVIGPNS